MRRNRLAAFCAMLMAAGAAGCGGSAPVVVPVPTAAPVVPRATTPRSYAALDTGAMRVVIYVATNRRFAASERPADRFNGDDAGSLQFAAVTVSVPPYRVRGVGDLPRQGTLSSTFGSAPDPAKAFLITGVIPVDSVRFVQRLAADLATTRSRNVLVFVHGFNVSFEDATLRAAQVAADMSFDGIVVLFTWPSAASVSSYMRDLQEARNAGYFLVRTLQGVVPAALPDRVNLLAHSMGSEVVAKALSIIPPGDSLPRLREVVLAAADYDARVFRRDILPLIRARAERVTLYASSDDDALRASRSVNGVWRLGLGGDSLTVVDGMDTIDATRVRGDMLGHTLFGNAGFLSDMAQLIGDGRGPAERRLLGLQRGGLTFWRFRGEAR